MKLIDIGSLPDDGGGDSRRYAGQKLNAMLPLVVKSKARNTPPTSVIENDKYIVAASPSAPWEGHEGCIAVWQNVLWNGISWDEEGGWMFLSPIEGTVAHLEASTISYQYVNGSWIEKTNPIVRSTRFIQEDAEPDTNGVYSESQTDELSVVNRNPRFNNRFVKLDRPLKQKVLCFADIQVDANPDQGVNDQVAKWRDIRDGMVAHHSDASWAIFAGDVVDRGHPIESEVNSNTNPWYGFDDMITDLSELNMGLQNILAIPGNHDVDYRPIADHREGNSFEGFLRHFPSQNFFILRGNMCFIFMGDMHDAVSGRIPDYVVDWWERIVLAHQKYAIVTITHQSLDGTINPTDTNPDTRIAESERFIQRMTREDNPARVDLWISGHHGANQTTVLSNRVATAHNDCTFVNVGVHIPTMLENDPVRDCTYFAMFLEDGSDKIILKHWNHETNSYIENQEIEITARTKIQLSSGFDFDGRYQYNSRFDFQTSPSRVFLELEGKNDEQFEGPYYGNRITLEDRRKRNVDVLTEAGIAIDLPGNSLTVDDDGLRNFGFGGALTVKRETVAELDFSATAILSGSNASRDDDSRVPGVMAHSDGTVTMPNGLRSDYVSNWTLIDYQTAPVTGTDFVHNLNIPEPYILDTKVFFWPGNGTRVFDWSNSHPVADITDHRLDGSLSFKDSNTISIAVGNHGVFAVDNIFGGGTVEYDSGYFLVIANKKPNLPPFPAVS